LGFFRKRVKDDQSNLAPRQVMDGLRQLANGIGQELQEQRALALRSLGVVTSQLFTPNPQPSTLNPEPRILNPTH
jgi:hypothetical protein